MAISFFCDRCGNGLNALYVGEELTCPHCGHANTAPAPLAGAAPPPPPTPPAPTAPDAPTMVMPPAAPPPPAAPQSPGYAPAPTYAPPAHAAPAPARPRRRGLGWACCCGCGAVAALLGLAMVIVAVFVAVPRVRAQAYLRTAIGAEMPVIKALGAYTSDPAWSTVRAHEFSPTNMGKARDALVALAKSSADARHAVDAAQKQIAATSAPTELADLHRDIEGINKLVTDSLNEMEPQIDYLAFVVQSLASAAKVFRELEGSSVGSLDQAAALLSKCRAAVKTIHDEIMVKSAPPGCEKLHTDTIKSLETMSSACSQMTEAIRARNYRRMLALSRTFESSMTGAAKRFESAYDSWGTQADRRSTQFAKEVKAKLDSLVSKLEQAQAKYGLPTSSEAGGAQAGGAEGKQKT